MLVEIQVNGQKLKAKKGDFLLDVLRSYGIRIPTLCSIEGFTPTGACRLCVVEVEGKQDLVPACSYPVHADMNIKTHSTRVIQARRAIVELLVSGHPDDCLYCNHSNHCELQQLANELNVKNRKNVFRKIAFKKDRTSQSLEHDPSKCVLCGRCIRICDDQQVSAIEFVGRGSELRVGTPGDRGLANSSCIACGQCIQACPTGSLSEKGQIEDLMIHLQEGHPNIIGLIDPAVMVSVGDELGFRPGKDLSGLLFSALRKCGFNQIHSGSEMVDLSLLLTATEWQSRLEDGQDKAIVSYCPATIRYLEKLRPDLLEKIIQVPRPSQLFGRLIKKQFNDAYVVFISPCIAAKGESKELLHSETGNPFVDCVLSTRELIQLVQLYGLDFDRIEPEVSDRALNGVHMSGLLSAVSGGYLEGLARALWALDPDGYPLQKKISRFRGVKVCKTSLMADFSPVQKWTACSSLSTVFDLIDRPQKTRQPELFEIMACQGGCINGGGQPGLRSDKTTKNRIKEIYDSDREVSQQVKAYTDKVLNDPDVVSLMNDTN